MKKIFSIVISLTIIATAISGCGNSESVGMDNKIITNTSSTTELITEETTSNNAADFLPSEYEAMQILKEYFTQQGYSFDSWSEENSTENNYQMLNKSSNTGAILISNGQLIFTINENNQIVYSSRKSTVIKVKNYDCYEVLNKLLSSIPDGLKPTENELKELADSIVPPGQKDIEKNGIAYSVAIGNDNTLVIMFNPS